MRKTVHTPSTSAPDAHGRMHRAWRVLAVAATAVALLLGAAPATAQHPDLPGPPSAFETIPAGSLIIAMDPALQPPIVGGGTGAAAHFNLRAYGLVMKLLWNDVPLKWAIKAGKTKLVVDATTVTDQADFTALTTQVRPTVDNTETSRTFYAGPFIVLPQHKAKALQVASAFQALSPGNAVRIYETTSSNNIDIRYTLKQKPFVAISNVNTQIHIDVYNAAGFGGLTAFDDKDPATWNCPGGVHTENCVWEVVNPAEAGSLDRNTCITIHSEPHRNDNDANNPAIVANVDQFLKSGGNVMFQCQSVSALEGHWNAGAAPGGRWLSTNGLTIANNNNTLTYPNADLAFSQFTSYLNPDTGGSELDFSVVSPAGVPNPGDPPGSGPGAFRNGGHVHAANPPAIIEKDVNQTWAAGAAKVPYDGPANNAGRTNPGNWGGMVMYLGGHAYATGSLNDLNGMRMLLNAVFVPSSRPASCQIDFVDADLAITKSDGKSSVDAGGSTTYTVRVTQNGTTPVAGAVLTDPVATGLTKTGVTCSAASGNTCVNPQAGLTINALQGAGVTLPTLATGEFFEIEIAATVSGSATGKVTNTATVAPASSSGSGTACTGASGVFDANANSCSASDTDSVNPIVNLWIVKTNSAASVVANGQTTYRVTVNNGGPSTLTGGTLVDGFVASLPKVSVACATPPLVGNTCTSAPSVGNLEAGFTLPDIASGGFYAIDVLANVAATSGQVTNSATVTPPQGTTNTGSACTPQNGGSFDPQSGACTSSDTDSVNAPDLRLSKGNASPNLTAGSTASYTLTVTNVGTAASSGTITVVDVLPTGLTVQGATPNPFTTGSWSCGYSGQVVTCTTAVVIGSASQIVIPVSVSNTLTGQVTNRAQVGGGNDPNKPTPTGTTAGNCSPTSPATSGCATATDTVRGASLSLAKSNGTNTVAAGSTTDYTLTVTNSGTADTSGTITVIDQLPAGLSIASGAVTLLSGAPTWSCTASGQVITCTSSTTIAATNGTSVFSFRVNVDGTASGTVINRAQVAGGGDPGKTNTPTPANCTANNSPAGCAIDQDTVDRNADLSIQKNGPATVAPNGQVVYTLTISNGGPASAHGATYQDVIPAGFAIQSATCGSPAGGAVCAVPSVNGQTVSGAVPTLPSGGSVVITITTNAPAIGSYTNTGTVNPPQGTSDPNTDNNTSRVTTRILEAPREVVEVPTLGTLGLALLGLLLAGLGAAGTRRRR